MIRPGDCPVHADLFQTLCLLNCLGLQQSVGSNLTAAPKRCPRPPNPLYSFLNKYVFICLFPFVFSDLGLVSISEEIDSCVGCFGLG